MCRFLLYSGEPLLISELLYRPTNSLIMQSYKSKERPEPLNGDGFGVGWYVPEIDATPCVVRSTTPAWSNRNLQNLAIKIKAEKMFAHIRAASPGMQVMEANVHPFGYDRFMFMHNGSVADFHKIKRALREGLRDEYYDMIAGTTDSEHSFALLLNELHTSFATATADDMRKGLVKTIKRLDELTRAAGITETSYYNFAITNGQAFVVSRYSSTPNTKGATLYYSRGERYECRADGVCDMHVVDDSQQARAVIVASEKLTDLEEDWSLVPDNHTVTVTSDLRVEVEAIEN